jgi:hypothetical protein
MNELVPMWAPHARREIDSLTNRDQVSLIEGDRVAACALAAQIAAVIGSSPRSVSDAGLLPVPVGSSQELIERLADECILFDIEAICWQPWLQIEPGRFLRTLARRSGVIAVWPGLVETGSASFSTPGRPDHVTFSATGFSVLRVVHTRFPDEVPFTIERISG